jgi:hypothetical protein
MNERIKELIEQATTKEDFYPAGCNGYPEYRIYFDKEKFAELIIKECLDMAINIVMENNCKEIFTSRTQIQWPIEEHFGVEE